MQDLTIGFIGAGNMASSLIQGLLAIGTKGEFLLAADIDTEKLSELSNACGIVASSNQDIADKADVIVLAVKPQVMKQVCSELDLAERSPLVVSIAAGIPVSNLQSWLGAETALVRCMPNTPALVGKGASGLFASSSVSAEQKDAAKHLMDAVGISVWVDNEADIDAVTALSGSGPAYYFLFLEAMQESARALGLSESVARQLSYQTAIGAAELALISDDDVAELRKKVTSPGGTTERALREFEAGGLRELVDKALVAARDRSIELAKQFGDN